MYMKTFTTIAVLAILMIVPMVGCNDLYPRMEYGGRIDIHDSNSIITDIRINNMFVHGDSNYILSDVARLVHVNGDMNIVRVTGAVFDSLAVNGDNNGVVADAVNMGIHGNNNTVYNICPIPGQWVIYGSNNTIYKLPDVSPQMIFSLCDTNIIKSIGD